MLAGARAGAIIILVKTGNGGLSLGRYREKWADVVPDYIADDILDAIGWITSNYLIK